MSEGYSLDEWVDAVDHNTLRGIDIDDFAGDFSAALRARDFILRYSPEFNHVIDPEILRLPGNFDPTTNQNDEASASFITGVTTNAVERSDLLARIPVRGTVREVFGDDANTLPKLALIKYANRPVKDGGTATITALMVDGSYRDITFVQGDIRPSTGTPDIGQDLDSKIEDFYKLAARANAFTTDDWHEIYLDLRIQERNNEIKQSKQRELEMVTAASGGIFSGTMTKLFTNLGTEAVMRTSFTPNILAINNKFLATRMSLYGPEFSDRVRIRSIKHISLRQNPPLYHLNVPTSWQPDRMISVPRDKLVELGIEEDMLVAAERDFSKIHGIRRNLTKISIAAGLLVAGSVFFIMADSNPYEKLNPSRYKSEEDFINAVKNDEELQTLLWKNQHT